MYVTIFSENPISTNFCMNPIYYSSWLFLSAKEKWQHQIVILAEKWDIFWFSNVYSSNCFIKMNTSGTGRFHVRVRVWSGLHISAKFGFGFIFFHFWSSSFWVYRVPTQHTNWKSEHLSLKFNSIDCDLNEHFQKVKKSLRLLLVNL